MSRDDLRWWGAAFGLVLLLAVVIYAAAWNLPLRGRVFSGFLINSTDSYGYQIFARSYADGGWLIDNPFTAVPRPPAFFNLFWLLLGKIMFLTGLPFIVVYYAAGILAAGLLYLAILLVMREFLGDGPRARYAFLLAGFASGLGWLAALVLYPGTQVAVRAPVDLNFPEGFPLQAALAFPHQALSFALLSLVLLWAWRGTATGRRRWMAAAGGLSLVLGFFHPYPLVTIAAVMIAWYLVLQVRRGRAFLPRWLDLAILGAGILPPVLYYRWLFAANENFAEWGRTNVVHTSIAAVSLGFGPLLLLAAVGLWRRWRAGELDDGTLFLATWAGVNLALLFSGRFINFEAKLVEGLVLPLGALGAAAVFGAGTVPTGAVEMAPRGRGLRRRWVAALLVLALLLPSHIYRLGSALRLIGGWRAFMIPTTWQFMYVLFPGELDAVDYLRRTVSPGAFFMCEPDSGVFLVAEANVKSYIGQMHSTPRYGEKLDWQQWFISADGTSAERLLFLRREKIDYVWFGPSERRVVGGPFTEEPYLEKVFDNGTVQIYEVRDDRLPSGGRR